MINSIRNVFKQRIPGKDASGVFYINIYRNGEFKFAYRYVDWTPDAIAEEFSKLESRFSPHNGFSVVR